MGNPSQRIQLLRKLWVHLTPLETRGLTPPDRIQRSGQGLGEVRRRELANLLTMERQLHDLRRGHASLDSAGRIVKTAEIRDIRGVKFSSIIESNETPEAATDALPDLAKLLEAAVEIERFDALERLLRRQKLYLLAERLILGMEIGEVDNTPIDRRWFNRWKLDACEISNGALQQLWARILVQELANATSTSLKALDYLASFSLQDADNLNRLASWTCGDFLSIAAHCQSCHPRWIRSFSSAWKSRASCAGCRVKFCPGHCAVRLTAGFIVGYISPIAASPLHLPSPGMNCMCRPMS